jgi:hypothetical protein
MPKAQQLVRVDSLAQSALALQRRTVKVRGLVVLPQLAVGAFSVQLVWQLELMVPAQKPATPPATTRVPQHTVPEPHSPLPVLPVQSSAFAGAVHDAAHVPEVLDALVTQQSSPEGHVNVPASAEWHDGPVHTPAPVQATEHAGVVVCHAPDALHVWG